ncbi:heterokaryon incompatibility protein-domain-containing protein [Phaeosphaeria sp. MPI-PUGE-AT-0046c]|nr:heterokaryon incompatibility protein-domain-containing protein [Phaeosphaeria sp. MPI-PUGE-AT-0046c]
MLLENIDPSLMPDDHVDSDLCVHCQSACDRWAEETNDEGTEYPHWNSIARLEDSAAAGCVMCDQLLQSRTQSATESAKEEIERLGPTHTRGILSFLELNMKSSKGEPNVVLEFAVLPAENQQIGAEVCEEDSKIVVCTYLADMIYVDGSDCTFNPGHIPAEDTIYPRHLIADWLHDCRQNHHQCRTSTILFVPSRLISTYPSRPVLVLKDDICGEPEYATLSHCWGQEKYDTLTSPRLEDFQTQGVPDSALSKTFQDAIVVARDLRIPYIWIDSLCIVQDDNDDWLREAATMSSVYGHSTLNIAASGAPSGRFGCFSSITVPTPRTFHITNSSGHAMTYTCLSVHYYKKSLGDMPLMERGWTLQERLLPSRSVHFTQTQVFWECYQRVACETFPEQLPTALTYADVYLEKKLICRSMWGWIIERYATCNLTYSADKMVAISGLARRIYSQTQDRYVAGMWESGLERQLCWRVVEGGSKGVRRAPTWSWVSLDSRLWWSYFDYYVGTEETELWIKILSIALEHTGDDAFGQVNSGCLRLSCSLLFHATFEHTEANTSIMSISKAMVRVHVTLDENYGNDCIRSAIALPVCSDLISDRLHGLLLQRVPDAKGQYFRLGLFAIDTREDREAFETAAADAPNSLGSPDVISMSEDELGRTQWVIDLV